MVCAPICPRSLHHLHQALEEKLAAVSKDMTSHSKTMEEAGKVHSIRISMHIHRTWLRPIHIRWKRLASRPSLGLVHQKNRRIKVGSCFPGYVPHIALCSPYMFARCCWFISILRILPKDPHVFFEAKILKAFEEKLTSLNKEMTTRSKTLEEACSKFCCFLGCFGHHNKSQQHCVMCVCCPFRGKSSNHCTGEKDHGLPFVYVGQNSNQVWIQRNHNWSFQATLEIYPIAQCMCISHYHLYILYRWYVRSCL